jgi:hypothetical protein
MREISPELKAWIDRVIVPTLVEESVAETGEKPLAAPQSLVEDLRRKTSGRVA